MPQNAGETFWIESFTPAYVNKRHVKYIWNQDTHLHVSLLNTVAVASGLVLKQQLR